jgi:hypothetical protein
MLHRPRAVRAAAAALAFASSLVAFGRDARAEQRTWNFLTTGNGHGFSVYDAQKNRVVTFLDHPYRYVKPKPDPRSDGYGRRNLAFDVYFGVKGGGGSAWQIDGTNESPEYVDQSHIIRAPATIAGVKAESFFFEPFGLERNALVGVLHAPGASRGYALMNFHMGGGELDPGADGESTRVIGNNEAIVETGNGQGAMVYVTIGGADGATCNDAFGKGKSGADFGADGGCGKRDDVAVGLQKNLSGDGWMGFVATYVDDPAQADAAATAIKGWLAGRTADKVLDDAKKEFEGWRKPAPEGALCSDDEKKVWRQGEAVLRMGQVREPNIPGRKNHGMILASLPPGEWHSGWVRDATYAIVALARMGHHAEAKMALDFFLNAEPVGVRSDYRGGWLKGNYRISVVRYFGTGEEEADYSGQQTPNIEIDGWGLVLWAARQYVDASGDTAWLSSQTRQGTVYEALKSGVADALAQNLEPVGPNLIAAADSSIWEVHDANKRHYAYTTLTAARGLCDMAQIANKAGKGGDVPSYQGLAKKLRDGYLASYVDAQGALGSSTEELQAGGYNDASTAEAWTFNILQDWKGDTAKATLDLLLRLRVDSGGFKRNDDGLSSYDNNEWILVDLRMANALRRAGRTGEADGVVAHVVQKAAANFYLLPELYNSVQSDGQIGKYTGSIPMVGYGGGAFVITILDRYGTIEPNDCGDGKGMTLPKVDCSSISTNPGGPGGPGGGDGGADNGGVPDASQIPFVAACVCNLGFERPLGPFGIAFVLGVPAILLLRRRKR